MHNESLHGIVLALVAVLAMGLPAQAQSQRPAGKDEQALTALVKQMSEAQAQFDAATLEKIYAADFIEISPVGEVDSREKTIGFYQPQAKPNRERTPPTVTADEFLIRTYKDFAIVIVRLTYALAANEASARPPFSIRTTLVCRKEKGAWKISSAQYTGIRPPRTPPAE